MKDGHNSHDGLNNQNSHDNHDGLNDQNNHDVQDGHNVQDNHDGHDKFFAPKQIGKGLILLEDLFWWPIPE